MGDSYFVVTRDDIESNTETREQLVRWKLREQRSRVYLLMAGIIYVIVLVLLPLIFPPHKFDTSWAGGFNLGLFNGIVIINAINIILDCCRK